MIPSLTVNRAKINARMVTFSQEASDAAVQQLKREARLFVEECVYLTPPYPQTAPLNTSLNEHRRAGEKAVIKGLQSVYKPLGQPISIPRGITETEWAPFQLHGKDSERLNKKIVEYANARNTSALTTMFKRLRIRYAGLLEQADPWFHLQRRDRFGRVRKGNGTYIVMDRSSVTALMKHRIGYVGYAVSGWRLAFGALGGKLPAWITRHNGPGIYEPGFSDKNHPWVRVGNAVPYIQENAMKLGIIARAHASPKVESDQCLMAALFSSFFRSFVITGTRPLVATPTQFNTGIVVGIHGDGLNNLDPILIQPGDRTIYPGVAETIASGPSILDASQFNVTTTTANDGFQFIYLLANPKAFNDIESKLELACVNYINTVATTMDDCSVTYGISDDEKTEHNINVHVSQANEHLVGSGLWNCTVSVEITTNAARSDMLSRHRLRTAYVRDLFMDQDAEQIIAAFLTGLTIHEKSIRHFQCEQHIAARKWIANCTFEVIATGSDLV
jgi:hypothetical protein